MAKKLNKTKRAPSKGKRKSNIEDTPVTPSDNTNVVMPRPKFASMEEYEAYRKDKELEAKIYDDPAGHFGIL